ncbi:hypothetical protein FBUS_02620 [Fasciolopsis buskii]|uniref:Uncharacterized protein n=1 Tax=Fasciolopsis buskii TaxID=27845 RepID=A0A8E0RS07_9TREM|nr:hypothetical protein FBUS_02620 [Fasciolopsis buski]
MACLIRVSGPVHTSLHKHTTILGDTDSDGELSQPEELSMEEAVNLVLHEETITTDTWAVSKNGKFFRVEFSVVGEEKMERILDRLAFYNVGKTEDSSIMVIEPTAFVYKRVKPQKSGAVSQVAFQDFLRSLKSRLCVAQVYNEINQRGTFDMNYLCFLICAAVVADVALVTNSAGVVFASMLLSPLMDPIVCILFGLNLREPHMLKKGIKNTAISLILCVGLGLTFGYVAHSVSNFERVSPYPTHEMKSRGQVISFLASMLVASFSGISVAFATLSKRVAALIGNAISLSLLPPAVNCGQLLLLSLLASSPTVTGEAKLEDLNMTLTRCTYPWVRDYNYIYVDDSCEASKEFAMLGAFSFLLVTMNILLILVTGYTVNTLKDMAPRAFTDATVRRFYQKDVPEVRAKYDCLHKWDAGNLASCAYKEYLRLNQINPDTDELSLEEKQRIASDFRAVLQGVEQDHHLRTVSANAGQADCSFLQKFVKQSRMLAHGSVIGTPTRPSLPASSNGYDSYRTKKRRPGGQGEWTRPYFTLSAQDDAFNHVILGENRSIRSLSIKDTLISGGAARARFEQLERLGELDYENSDLQAALASSEPSALLHPDATNIHANNVGKFHVVPTQLSMEPSSSAPEDDLLERV